MPASFAILDKHISKWDTKTKTLPPLDVSLIFEKTDKIRKDLNVEQFLRLINTTSELNPTLAGGVETTPPPELFFNG